MLAACWCRAAVQRQLLLLLIVVGLLLIGLLAVRESALSGAVSPVLRPPAAPPAPAAAETRPPPPSSAAQVTRLDTAWRRPSVCPPPGRILSINSAGRLGNVMSEYATLLAAGRTLGRPAWLLPDMARALAASFEPPSLPVLPAVGCERNWTVVSAEKLLNERPASDSDYLISGFPHTVPLFHPLRRQLLLDFSFKAKLRARADSRLTELARRANLRSPTFIGVHVRRTDYKVWLARQVGGHVVGTAYLRRAMALMRHRHPSALFVVVSDDLEWCRRELHGLELVVPSGDSNVRRPGADLALLAACNHTVVTHGTFGFWAAYLAGGEVVAPTGYGRRPTGLERDVRRARLGWTWLPVDGGRPQPDG